MKNKENDIQITEHFSTTTRASNSHHAISLPEIGLSDSDFFMQETAISIAVPAVIKAPTMLNIGTYDLSISATRP